MLFLVEGKEGNGIFSPSKLNICRPLIVPFCIQIFLGGVGWKRHKVGNFSKASQKLLCILNVFFVVPFWVMQNRDPMIVCRARTELQSTHVIVKKFDLFNTWVLKGEAVFLNISGFPHTHTPRSHILIFFLPFGCRVDARTASSGSSAWEGQLQSLILSEYASTEMSLHALYMHEVM